MTPKSKFQFGGIESDPPECGPYFYTLPAEFLPSKIYVMRTVDTGMMAQIKAERAAQIERNTKGLIDIMVRFHEEDHQAERAAIRAEIAGREEKP